MRLGEIGEIGEIGETGETTVWQIPTYRFDLDREIDLVEEVGRCYGYDHVPSLTVNKGPLPRPIDPSWKLRTELADILGNLGYLQILGNTLDTFDRLRHFVPRDQIIPLRNPMSEEFTHLRPSLIPALLEAVSLNIRQNAGSIMLFECDKVYRYENGKPSEKYNLAIAISGELHPKQWHNLAPEKCDYYHIKGICGHILDSLKIEAPFQKVEREFLDKEQNFAVSIDDRTLCAGGLLSPTVAGAFDIKAPVYVFEMEIDPIISKSADDTVFKMWSKFPQIDRDVALIMDKSILAGDVISFARESKVDNLRGISIFDLYAKKPIPKGLKSLGLSMIYRSDDRTLTDDEIDSAHRQLVDSLCKKFEATIRDK